jgi:hypothetical protein
MRLSAPLWLRLAAGVAALYALGHTLGHPWTAPHDLMAQGVTVAMQGVHFDAAGHSRSYWEFYQGFGLAISVLLALQAVLLWQLAALARTGQDYRIAALAHLLAFLGLAAIAYRYLFALPLWLALTIAACLAAALLQPAGEHGRGCAA